MRQFSTSALGAYKVDIQRNEDHDTVGIVLQVDHAYRTSLFNGVCASTIVELKEDWAVAAQHAVLSSMNLKRSSNSSKRKCLS
jgi:hypothetical protein